MNYAHLKRIYESHGVAEAGKVFAQAIKEKKIDPYRVCFSQLREEMLGRDYFTSERKLKALQRGQVHLLEASEAVDASAFSNITGQLLVTIIKEKYESAEFIGDSLVKKTPNPGANLREHKVPYLSDVLDEGAQLQQGEEYPQTTFAESWVTLPAPEKYGQICAVTMEALYSDLTGQIQDSAASIGRALGYRREKRILRVVLGLTNPYKWNDNSLNTYVSTATTGNYVNKKLSNTITSYKHIEAVEKLFWEMVDPITSRSIMARPTAILCAPEKRYELKRILGATETRSGDITTGTGDQVVAPNPLEINYSVISSPIARALLDAETELTADEIKEKLYFGDFTRAFGYREVYPMRTEEAPPNNPAEFRQDIVLQVKCSEYGVPYVYDPRYAAISTSEGP